MDAKTAARILQASAARSTGNDACLEFVDLIYSLDTPIGYEGLKVLMKTYTNEDDYGTQESVNACIQLAAPEDLARAIIEELPRLVELEEEWAEVLVYDVLREQNAAFVRIARESSGVERKALGELLSSSSFVRDFGSEFKREVLGD